LQQIEKEGARGEGREWLRDTRATSARNLIGFE
jgi:hypothetical protein